MLDRFQPILKMLCLALAALLLVHVIDLVRHSDPLGHATIPPLPTLTVEAKDKDAPTNKMAKAKGGATNAIAHGASSHKETNAMARMRPSRHGGGFPGGFPMGFGGPGAQAKLPAPVQARVDRIKDSEILGPVMHPMPMALLGIADDDAFLRAPNGQTGMIKEGGELGGVKLLRIGINRVLVEADGKKQELTLFSGFGSDSLMPKEPDTSTNSNVTPDTKETP